MKIQKVGSCFVGEASGIDLTRPLSKDEIAGIHAGMDEYAVLIFHDQRFTDEQQLSFSRSLGELESYFGASLRTPNEYRLPTTFADVSNLDQNNQPFAYDDRRRLFAIGNRLWHSDSSFKVTPAKYSILRAHEIPSKGGNTEFADMRAAYESFDQETKELIKGLVCEHSQMYSRRLLGFTDFSEEEQTRFQPVRQSLVRIHPSTGQKSVYLSSHAGDILGWPRPEALSLLRDLTELATQREFVYSHEWRQYDLVIWDNRRTMHRARPFPSKEPRDMRRTTLKGEGPTAEQAVA